jgi:hypothetical protein
LATKTIKLLLKTNGRNVHLFRDGVSLCGKFKKSEKARNPIQNVKDDKFCNVCLKSEKKLKLQGFKLEVIRG